MRFFSESVYPLAQAPDILFIFYVVYIFKIAFQVMSKSSRCPEEILLFSKDKEPNLHGLKC